MNPVGKKAIDRLDELVRNADRRLPDPIREEVADNLDPDNETVLEALVGEPPKGRADE